MRGYCEALKALSAIASITSCSQGENDKIKASELKSASNERTLVECSDSHLEGDLSGHSEAVGDVGLLVRRAALPAVQLYTAAAGQQHLPVHLH